MNTRHHLMHDGGNGEVPDYAIAINVGRRAQARGVRQAFQALGNLLRRRGDADGLDRGGCSGRA